MMGILFMLLKRLYKERSCSNRSVVHLPIQTHSLSESTYPLLNLVIWNLNFSFIMLLIPTLLSLVAGVSAIDIWLNLSALDCKGKNSLHCANVGSNQCCGVPSMRFGSLHFKEIPTEWNLEVRGHDVSRENNGCGTMIARWSSNGETDVCVGAQKIDDTSSVIRNYGGGGYGFIGKRSEQASDCQDPVRPSTLIFEDGVKYNLTDLDDSTFHELVSIFRRKTG